MFYFLTFGAGSQDYLDALARISRQAEDLQVFDKVIGLNDKDLKDDGPFWEKHGHFIETHWRGYGHWIWKPYIILKTLLSMNDGDLLMYLDSGCELDFNHKGELDKYLEHVNRNGIPSKINGIPGVPPLLQQRVLVFNNSATCLVSILKK